MAALTPAVGRIDQRTVIEKRCRDLVRPALALAGLLSSAPAMKVLKQRKFGHAEGGNKSGERNEMTEWPHETKVNIPSTYVLIGCGSISPPHRKIRLKGVTTGAFGDRVRSVRTRKLI